MLSLDIHLTMESQWTRSLKGDPPQRGPFKGRFFGGAGGKASLPGFGVSPMLLFLPLAASGSEKNRKKRFGGSNSLDRDVPRSPAKGG